MKNGRKRKPVALRLVEGNRGHRPIPTEPKFSIPADMPTPPSFLDRYARQEWKRVAPELYALGLLTTVDTSTLAAYCVAFSRWRFAEEELQRLAKVDDKTIHGGLVQVTKQGNAIQSVILGVANSARAAMVRIAAEFGLTPSSRSNLQGGKRDGDDPTEKKFFAG